MRAQQIAHAPRAVADRIAAMRRRHPLVDDHRLRTRLFAAAPCRSPGGTAGAPRAPRAASNCSQKSKATCGCGARGAARISSTKPSSVPAKSFAAADRRRRAGRRRSRPAAPRFDDDRVHQRRDVRSDPCRRTARRRRPSSPAPRWPRRRAPAPACRTPRRAARRSLRARWRTGTDRRPRRRRPALRRTRGRRNARAAAPSAGDQLVQRRQVAFEPAVGADDQQPRPRVEHRVVGVEEADQILDLLVRDHPADEQRCWSSRRRTARPPASSAARSRCEKSGTTGSTAVRGKPSASRSWRLNSESPSARSQRSA